MANLLLAWELGGGLGHAGRLKPLALELANRGHRVTLALRDLVHTRTLLGDLPGPRVQAPVWLHDTVGVSKKPASLAEILLGQGYLDANALAGLVDGWRGLIDIARADVVVADYAPTAIAAARTLGVASVAVGLGFYLPPAGQPLPSLRDWTSLAPGRLEESEAALLRSVNDVLRRHRSAPYLQGWQVFAGDRSLVCTWPELDPYMRAALPPGEHWYGPTFLPESGVAPEWPDGDGPRVFAYLKAADAGPAALLAALVAQGCRTLCYLPDVAAGKPAPVEHPSIRYSRGPVNLSLAFADASLCVCHGGGATVAQSLLAGVPLLLLPTQGEQFLTARRLERTGAAINAGARPKPVDFDALVVAMIGDDAAHAAARAFAEKHHGFTHAQQTQDLCDAIEATANAHDTHAASRSRERSNATR